MKILCGYQPKCDFVVLNWLSEQMQNPDMMRFLKGKKAVQTYCLELIKNQIADDDFMFSEWKVSQDGYIKR